MNPTSRDFGQPDGAATIAAPATATGPSGIAVLRISGPEAHAVAARVVCLPEDFCWERAAGRWRHVRVHHPRTRETLDDAVMLVFRAPRSYTGDDAVELQCHGGSLSVRRLLDAVLTAGARPAEPGEFTRRAFINGRLDLTQAEAVLDLINARTDRAAQAARSQLDGRLGREIDDLYTGLTAVCAEIEAWLDFDETEVPGDFNVRAAETLERLSGSMRALADTWHAGHLLRDGAMVVISGRPNVGKSSLLNALLGHARAIVSSTPGTTRDSIEESLVLEGIPVRLVDTAGLRVTRCEIESEGVARADNLMARADLNLHVLDLSRPLTEEDRRHLDKLKPSRGLLVFNKCDLVPRLDADFSADWRRVRTSAATGLGIDQLKRVLADALGLAEVAPMGLDVSARHRREIESAMEAADEAAGLLRENGAEGLVLAAGSLRRAAGALGRITGREYSEDLLDTIFRRFCVGK